MVNLDVYSVGSTGKLVLADTSPNKNAVLKTVSLVIDLIAGFDTP